MQQKKDFDKKDEQKALPAGQTTNNLFVGSTTDLQRMLLNQNSDNIIDISEHKKDE